MIYSDRLDRKMRVKLNFDRARNAITKLLLELISLSHGTNDRRNEKKKKKRIGRSEILHREEEVYPKDQKIPSPCLSPSRIATRHRNTSAANE